MEEIAGIMKERLFMYRLLGRIFLKETDKNFLETLKEIDLQVDTGNHSINEGWKRFRSAVNGKETQDLDYLAAEYARLFLGAGKPEGGYCYPHESVYTSPERIVSQDAYEDCLKTYRANGMKCQEKGIYEDHIGYELGFMANLCEEAAKAGTEPEMEDILLRQKDFYKKHLANWTKFFISDIKKMAEYEFYLGAGLLLEGFLKEEEEFFEAVA